MGGGILLYQAFYGVGGSGLTAGMALAIATSSADEGENSSGRQLT